MVEGDPSELLERDGTVQGPLGHEPPAPAHVRHFRYSARRRGSPRQPKLSHPPRMASPLLLHRGIALAYVSLIARPRLRSGRAGGTGRKT